MANASCAAAEVPEVGTFLVVVLGFHPGMPESEVVIVVVRVDAGDNSAARRVHRMDKAAAPVDRIDAIRRRHLLHKRACDVYSCHETDVVEALRVLDETRQRVGSFGPPGIARMEANGHHPTGVIAIARKSKRSSR